MHLPDLSPYPYGRHPHRLSVGWLDTDQPFAQGTTPVAFHERLLQYVQRPPFATMGQHACPFCDQTAGSGEVWVFDGPDTLYFAPELIYHYVTAHHYCPPSEFVNAVLTSATSDTEAYQEFIRQARKR